MSENTDGQVLVVITQAIVGVDYNYSKNDPVELSADRAKIFVDAGMAELSKDVVLEGISSEARSALTTELSEMTDAFELAEQKTKDHRVCLVDALVCAGLEEIQGEVGSELGKRLVLQIESISAERDDAKSEALEMQAQAVTLGEQVAELTAEKLVLETDLAAAVEVATEAEEAQAGLDFPEESEGEPAPEAEAEAEGE